MKQPLHFSISNKLKLLALFLLVGNLFYGQTPQPDSDGDGFTNNIDLDADNDGILDANEKTFCDENQNTQVIEGDGAHIKDIVFFDWSGLNITGSNLTSGSYTSEFIHNGVTYKAEIKNVVRSANFAIKATKINAYNGGYAHTKYNPSGDTDAISFNFSRAQQNGKFEIEFTATKDGVTYPIEVLVLDAQVTNNNYSGTSEDLIFETNGSSFTLFEELGGIAGDTDAITGEGTSTLEYVNSRPDDTSINNRNAIFSTSGSPVVIKTYAERETGRTGTQAAAYAIVLYCDTDDDGIPNYLDLDSDNDGCLDAVEGGGEINPSSLVNAAGEVTVGVGSRAKNQNLCADADCVDSNGIPKTAEGGQAIGASQDASDYTSCICEFKPKESTPSEFTKVGISTLDRNVEEWLPQKKGAYIVLESDTKPFVVTRTVSKDVVNPTVGMLIWDIADKCMKLYDGETWNCIKKGCYQ